MNIFKKTSHPQRILCAFLTAACLGGTLARPASASLDVVASLPELAAISKAVGGDKISVYTIAKPGQDYHTAEPRPSDVSRLAHADLLVRSGLGLDMWMDSLMNAAGNPKLNRGGSAYVDASVGIPVIEMPTEGINGASGDVHPDGNPHYYYDPVYAKFIARNVVKGLIRVDPKDAAEFRANYAGFNKAIDQRLPGWERQLAPFAGKYVVTYHRNYNYFIRRFGLKQYGTLEPRPGIPPSASHIAQLMSNMKRDGVNAIVVEGIYPKHYPDLMARSIGAKYEYGPYSVTALTEDGYLSMIDSIVSHFKAALN